MSESASTSESEEVPNLNMIGHQVQTLFHGHRVAAGHWHFRPLKASEAVPTRDDKRQIQVILNRQVILS